MKAYSEDNVGAIFIILSILCVIFALVLGGCSLATRQDCLTMSRALHERLNREGIKNSLVIGEYDGKRHAWVECQGRILDPGLGRIGTKSEYRAEIKIGRN